MGLMSRLPVLCTVCNGNKVSTSWNAFSSDDLGAVCLQGRARIPEVYSIEPEVLQESLEVYSIEPEVL